MLKSFETINGLLFCLFCVSYSKALRYMSACTQFAFDCLFYLRTDMCRHLICTAIFQFCMHDSACFESPPSFSGIVCDIIYRTALHSIMLKAFSILTTSIYLLFAVSCVCYVFYSIWAVSFFSLFLSMEALQAQRERKLYVALKPDQAACVL